jgi:hypothetical protein
LSWSNASTLHAELQKRNTTELKEICCENGIPRSGAKYEIVANIQAHVKGYTEQQKQLEIKKSSASGDLSSSIRLEVLKIKKLEGVYKYCTDFNSKILAKQSGTSKQLQSLQGLTEGTLDQILNAVTGPRAAHYNGKYGELAMETSTLLGELWLTFLKINHNSLTNKEVENWLTSFSRKHKSEDFGYYHLLALYGDEIAEIFDKEELKKIILEKTGSVSQYGRDKRKNKRQKQLYSDDEEEDEKTAAPVVKEVAVDDNKENENQNVNLSTKKKEIIIID